MSFNFITAAEAASYIKDGIITCADAGRQNGV